jgi:DNA-binding SARP family transcriptional activator
MRADTANQTAERVVHLFDGPYVTIARRRVDVPEGSKRLLAFVALRHGRVERRHAAGALWPCGDDHRAAGNLRSSLWRLRGAGIDVLSADKWSLCLHDGVLVDSQLTLDWATRLITNNAHSDDLAILPDRLDALDLLPGWYDDWTIIERERIRQRILHALEALSRLLARAGRYADAVEAALTAINSEPLRESAQRALIEVHAAEGNWVEARRGYLAYRDLVRRELGVEPSSELTALINRAQHCAPQFPQRHDPARSGAATG